MFRRKKSVIKVTFDPYHNLPMMKAKNCTDEQILDAALFMQGHVKIDCKTVGCQDSNRRGRKESRIHKFFRIIAIIIFKDCKKKDAHKSVPALLPSRLV